MGVELIVVTIAPAQFSSPPQPGGLLFKLPPELRNVIYELVVTRKGKMAIVNQIISNIRSPVQPDLTRTCSKIRTEALPIFYGINTFIVFFSSALMATPSRQWLRVIGKSNRDCMKEVLVPSRDWTGRDGRVPKADLPFIRALERIVGPDVRVVVGHDCHVFDLQGAETDDLERVLEEDGEQ